MPGMSRVSGAGGRWRTNKTDYLLDIDPEYFDQDGELIPDDDPRRIIVRWDSGFGYTLTGRLDYLEALS